MSITTPNTRRIVDVDASLFNPKLPVGLYLLGAIKHLADAADAIEEERAGGAASRHRGQRSVSRYADEWDALFQKIVSIAYPPGSLATSRGALECTIDFRHHVQAALDFHPRWNTYLTHLTETLGATGITLHVTGGTVRAPDLEHALFQVECVVPDDTAVREGPRIGNWTRALPGMPKGEVWVVIACDRGHTLWYRATPAGSVPMPDAAVTGPRSAPVPLEPGVQPHPTPTPAQRDLLAAAVAAYRPHA